MSRSGVGVSAVCVSKFNELKLGKSLAYIIYGLSADKKEVVVVKDSSEDSITDPSDKAAVYESFLTNLPEDDCRYAVYDFPYEKDASEGKRNKIVFLAWSPDTAPVKSKMVYASSKESVRRALNGIAVEIQGTDFSEVSYETILEKVSKGR